MMSVLQLLMQFVCFTFTMSVSSVARESFCATGGSETGTDSRRNARRLGESFCATGGSETETGSRGSARRLRESFCATDA